MTTTAIHYHGYEGDVEEHVPVESFHRAKCEDCDWVSAEFDDLDWQSAEQEAVEHWQDMHADQDEDEDE